MPPLQPGSLLPPSLFQSCPPFVFLYSICFLPVLLLALSSNYSCDSLFCFRSKCPIARSLFVVPPLLCSSYSSLTSFKTPDCVNLNLRRLSHTHKRLPLFVNLPSISAPANLPNPCPSTVVGNASLKEGNLEGT